MNYQRQITRSVQRDLYCTGSDRDVLLSGKFWPFSRSPVQTSSSGNIFFF